MRSPFRRPGGPRRGVTLVEMLVVVALVVLMMTILVQIFQSATGAMSLSRTTQELDVTLRQVDSMIRTDLNGVTARMTPPNDPALKTGYFEYGENSPADEHGEDTDDFLAFTTKLPEGQVFSGRQFLPIPGAGTLPANDPRIIRNDSIQPTTVRSQVGEVIYFLRNGNLYRRTFLVAPDRAKSIVPGNAFPANSSRATPMFGGALYSMDSRVSWQGLNDISCRPGGFSAYDGNVQPLPPIPNDLGDLTNRENRAFRPRFLNDFRTVSSPGDAALAPLPDTVPDDGNGDGIPDYYPTLYTDGTGGWGGRPNGHVNEFGSFVDPSGGMDFSRLFPASYDIYAFPFIYPGMFSVPDDLAPVRRFTNGLGWIHSPSTRSTDATYPIINHSPIDPPSRDSLLTPNPQTWWGFPTWRETMTGTRNGVLAGWTDPVVFVTNNNNTYVQPLGLRPFPPDRLPALDSPNFLPPVYDPGTDRPSFSFDGAGSGTFVVAPVANGSKQQAFPNPVWEDDLILTNVRSFDVKAYDFDAPRYNTTNNGLFSAGYHDLGYGSIDFVAGVADNTGNQVAQLFQGIGQEPIGFGHEGRIPPRTHDFRFHPRFGNNIGDDGAGVIRLTRVWDSWSTDYTNAPDSDVLHRGFVPGVSTDLPIYPSFPPPYPSPLRGIQIQIRVADPRNERVKVLTIRHDFSDKL